MSLSRSQFLNIAASLPQKKPASSYYLPLSLSPVAEASESTVPPYMSQKSTASASTSNIPVSAAPTESTDVWMKVARESSLKRRKVNPAPPSAAEKMALQLLAMYQPALKAKRSLPPNPKPVAKRCPFTTMGAGAPSLRSDDSMVWTESSWDSVSLYSDMTTDENLSPPPSKVRRMAWGKLRSPQATTTPQVLATPSPLKAIWSKPQSPQATRSPPVLATPTPLKQVQHPQWYSKMGEGAPSLRSDDSMVWTESSYDLTEACPVRSKSPTIDAFPSLKKRIVRIRSQPPKKAPAPAVPAITAGRLQRLGTRFGPHYRVPRSVMSASDALAQYHDELTRSMANLPDWADPTLPRVNIVNPLPPSPVAPKPGIPKIEVRPWCDEKKRCLSRWEMEMKAYNTRLPKLPPITKADLFWPSKKDGDCTTMCSDEDWEWMRDELSLHAPTPQQPSEPAASSVTSASSVLESICSFTKQMWASAKRWFFQ